MALAVSHVVHHNNWANTRLLEFLAGLPEQHLELEAPGNYGTIRSTIVHLVRSQARYVGRAAQDPAPEQFSELAGWPGWETLRAALDWSAPRLVQVAAEADEGAVVEFVREGVRHRAAISTLIVQAVHHAQEHRTNITTILAAAGIESPELSGWTYGER